MGLFTNIKTLMKMSKAQRLLGAVAPGSPWRAKQASTDDILRAMMAGEETDDQKGCRLIAEFIAERNTPDWKLFRRHFEVDPDRVAHALIWMTGFGGNRWDRGTFIPVSIMSSSAAFAYVLERMDEVQQGESPPNFSEEAKAIEAGNWAAVETAHKYVTRKISHLPLRFMQQYASPQEALASIDKNTH